MSEELINQLRGTLSKLELALGLIKESILLLNLDGTIQWCNESFSNYIEKKHIEILGKHFNEVIQLNAIHGEMLPLDYLKKNPEEELIQEYHYKNKTHRILNIYAAKTKLEESTESYVIVISDITSKKEREQIMLQSQKLEGIGTLAAGVAHEMNTPIQYINDNMAFLRDNVNDVIQFAELICSMVQRYDSVEKLRNDIQTTYENVDFEYLRQEVPACILQTQNGTEIITRLVRSMKEFSHPGSKDLDLIDVKRVVETVVDVTRNEWKYISELEIEIEDGCNKAYSIQSELNQIVMNLIVNARDAIEEKYGAEKKGIIKIYTKNTEDFLELFIEDNANGIPEKVINKIFDPFFTTKAPGKGTGQGLAIIYSALTSKLKGSIDVQSKIGEGTTFKISLPKKLKKESK